MSQALIELLIALALLGGEIHEGFAPHYAPGLMNKVAARRGIEPEACMVSSVRYAIGTWVYVYSPRTKVLRYCKVVDVSHPRDKARHLRTGREIEIPYELAREVCGSTKERPERCPVIVYRVDE